MSQLDAPRLAGHFALTAIPDTVDFRDRMFEPTLVEVPTTRPFGRYVEEMCGAHEILDQGADGACTGFALAAVAQYLLATRDRRRNGDGSCDVPAEPVSPWMLYGMAQRYDEWPGEDYSGSSARGAMKAWHRHGVCRRDLWAHPGDVSASEWAARWADARQRPLGAYYRVNHKDLVAMHAALAEVGVLFATAHVHEGWLPDELGELELLLHEIADGIDAHNAREEHLLGEVLPHIDAWGSVRLSRMDEHHRKEHRRIANALREASASGEFHAAARRALPAIDALLEHMRQEEEEFLGEDVLRDDVVDIDQTGG
jgi:hypothetical protein